MRPEPTEEELRAAFAHCRARRPSGWPATFEDAMADDTLSRLLRITARHPPAWMRSQPAPAPAPTPSSSTADAFLSQARPRARRFHTGIDRKRAAAGERDED